MIVRMRMVVTLSDDDEKDDEIEEEEVPAMNMVMMVRRMVVVMKVNATFFNEAVPKLCNGALPNPEDRSTHIAQSSLKSISCT